MIKFCCTFTNVFKTLYINSFECTKTDIPQILNQNILIILLYVYLRQAFYKTLSANCQLTRLLQHFYCPQYFLLCSILNHCYLKENKCIELQNQKKKKNINHITCRIFSYIHIWNHIPCLEQGSLHSKFNSY